MQFPANKLLYLRNSVRQRYSYIGRPYQNRVLYKNHVVTYDIG